MISFNALLESGGYDLPGVRLLRHNEPAAVRGRSCYELWRDDRLAFDRYQAEQDTRAHRSFVTATHWASFVGTPEGDTMFAGVYRARYLSPSSKDIIAQTTGVTWPAGSIYLYDLVEEAYLHEYIGRLFISWGSGTRAWLQRGDGKPKPIVEIKRKFTEEDFPGYLEFSSSLTRLPILPAAWKSALSAARGIYVLTCPKTKELYIGSATGSDGFFGRWSDYALDGHGGNIQLKSRDRSDYQVAILETAGSSMSIHQIQILESQWKHKLQTRKMGLNSN